MFLKELNLTNYKNFETIRFNFNTKIVCFVGLNGVVKLIFWIRYIIFQIQKATLIL